MDLGYDAYLAAELAAHNRRCADTDRFHELVAERALDLGNDAERFLEWIAEHDTRLWDIKVTSSVTGKKVTAAAALIAHAPAWLRELVLEGGEIHAEALMDASVQYATGRTSSADVALIANAPEWLRAELVDWLSAQSMLEADVKEIVADERRQQQEDAAADRYLEVA